MPSPVPYRIVKKMLRKLGYHLDRVSGSHHIFEKPGCAHHVNIVVHNKEVNYGYVKEIKKLEEDQKQKGN